MQLSLGTLLPGLLLGLACGCANPPEAPAAPSGPAPARPGSGDAPGDPTARGAAPAAEDSLAPLRAGESASGRYRVRWRPLAGAVPTNEPFELELFLERDGAPAAGVDVVVRGWMPDHGHGMLRRPEVEDRGDGSYLVRGMLLHMGGFWELYFDVYEPGERKDRVRFEVEL